MADRFYTPDLLSPGEWTLSGPDAHHMTTVRRFVPGDAVVLFNGDGGEYPAEVVAIGKKQVTLQILRRDAVCREVPFPVVVGSALPKGDRTDYLIEKLVEVGCTRFVPLITERSVVIPKENTLAKLERQVIEASKQCGRNVLMQIAPPRLWAEFVHLADLPEVKYVLHTIGGETPQALGGGVVFAVGPEGGFSAAEVSAATIAGWRVASFGPRVLRVETAALVVAAWAADRQ
ncbi:MAG: 16S rRNA (uracil(1498)-N(3))-methyltransferase [Fimbriiglobus sp.]|jgi:16S rRNA (uracil1498-N3)-methyltransferase|nr:16S rRNA (uracil(1498)-N(3))-methyltransferase [Fimbriiglobus sp.]